MKEFLLNLLSTLLSNDWFKIELLFKNKPKSIIWMIFSLIISIGMIIETNIPSGLVVFGMLGLIMVIANNFS